MIKRSSLFSSLFLCLPLAASAQDAPPGLVLVKGGKTKVGSKVKDVEPLIVANRQFANTFAGETPQHTQEVADFYLMPTEVTNEQYAEFVRATGHRPPYYWCAEADLEAGRQGFLEEQERLRKEALAADKAAPPRKTFDAAVWWAENWKDKNWTIPTEDLNTPICFVSHPDAEAYSRWAGLRLMTEGEYHRAARGDSDRTFPWGDDWKPDLCNSLEYTKMDRAMPVGSFAEGAVNGIFDLAGNVWEWTSSKYTKFEDYKPLKVKNGRDSIEGLAGFDPVMRVLAGGAFTNQGFACRVAVRMPAERRQQTEAVGFRCAADLLPGRCAAQWLLEKDVRLHVLTGDVGFKPDGTTAIQRWTFGPGTAGVPGYAVIQRYERTLFVPSLSLAAGSRAELERITGEQGPVVIGLFSSEHPLRKPELDGGSYFVAWRAAGKLKAAEPAPAGDTEEPLRIGGSRQDGVAFHEVPGFDETVDQLFLYNLEGNPILAWASGPIDFKRATQGSQLTFVKFVPPAEEPEEDAPPVIPLDTLRVDVVVDAQSRKALHLAFEVKITPGLIDESWK